MNCNSELGRTEQQWVELLKDAGFQINGISRHPNAVEKVIGAELALLDSHDRKKPRINRRFVWVMPYQHSHRFPGITIIYTASIDFRRCMNFVLYDGSSFKFQSDYYGSHM